MAFSLFLNEGCNSYYCLVQFIVLISLSKRGTCVLKEAPKHVIMHGISSILVWG